MEFPVQISYFWRNRLVPAAKPTESIRVNTIIRNICHNNFLDFLSGRRVFPSTVSTQDENATLKDGRNASEKLKKAIFNQVVDIFEVADPYTTRHLLISFFVCHCPHRLSEIPSLTKHSLDRRATIRDIVYELYQEFGGHLPEPGEVTHIMSSDFRTRLFVLYAHIFREGRRHPVGTQPNIEALAMQYCDVENDLLLSICRKYDVRAEQTILHTAAEAEQPSTSEDAAVTDPRHQQTLEFGEWPVFRLFEDLDEALSEHQSPSQNRILKQRELTAALVKLQELKIKEIEQLRPAVRPAEQNAECERKAPEQKDSERYYLLRNSKSIIADILSKKKDCAQALIDGDVTETVLLPEVAHKRSGKGQSSRFLDTPKQFSLSQGGTERNQLSIEELDLELDSAFGNSCPQDSSVSPYSACIESSLALNSGQRYDERQDNVCPHSLPSTRIATSQRIITGYDFEVL